MELTFTAPAAPETTPPTTSVPPAMAFMLCATGRTTGMVTVSMFAEELSTMPPLFVMEPPVRMNAPAVGLKNRPPTEFVGTT